MNHRILGRTGLRVSEIGFGAWAIGGQQEGARRSYGPTDDRVSLAALERAWELGGKFIDTADAYGVGHSETLIGQFLAGHRDRVIVATKFGHFPFADPARRIPTPDNIRFCLEESLRRLGTDYIDLYQCHECPLATAQAYDVPGTMERLRAEGKIRHAGISVYGANQIRQVARGEFGAVFSTIQESYNVTTLLFRDALHEAAAAGLGIIVREPLGNGLLSGRWTGREDWDARHARGIRASDQTAMRVEFARRVGEFLPGPRRSLVQALIRFSLQDVPASVVIPGCKTAAQVEENFGATDSPPLSASDLAAVHRVHDELLRTFGHIHPYAMDNTLGLE
jgi:aryl-alcohol dehydrogenase-like predicted oxidoreductase